jgi:galactose mutarotase-like enzyme
MAASVAGRQSGGDPVYFSRPGVALVTWNPDLRAVCLEPQAWANTASPRALD